VTVNFIGDILAELFVKKKNIMNVKITLNVHGTLLTFSKILRELKI